MTVRKFKIILDMIKFEHTIFALPFAIMSAFIASDGLPPMDTCGWILLAMVGARSCAMAFNRIVDAKIDGANPRTSMRAIPAGLITASSVWIFTAVSAALLVYSAYNLNSLAFALSPLALVITLGYSYTKRFTSLSHFWLGLSLSIAPIGAWIAVTSSLDWVPMLLGLSVLLWTAGFDIIYACQDFEFDRHNRLHSIPARFGIRRALWLSSALHLITVSILVGLAVFTNLGTLYLIGVGVVTLILIYEHVIVSPNDLSRVNVAFFTLNGMVSLVLSGLAVADLLV
ncbi:MAG: putative 4-hydroxybenzoate polyprenyltransferase [Candidatus Poribacteria bacterium]|nr:putative 4-hydroxybenzoate polyprenyltransferase [Candidatus Poribacteria bacterium]MDE0503268.1 putative 4-hydroxybenzoate polyprenyltransferase [Candidatus Poribacteria bacterium]